MLPFMRGKKTGEAADAGKRRGSAGSRNPLAWMLEGPWPDLVGVDLSDTSLKVVHLVRRGRRVVRVDAADRTLTASEAQSQDRRGALRQALREVVEQLGLRGMPAASPLYGAEVVIRRLTFPDMRQADILPALTLECRKHVSFPIEEAEIRYEILGRAERGDRVELEILVAVAHRRWIDEVRDSLAWAGLKPAAVTIRPIALRALLRETGRLASSEDVVAYLDMGAGVTHIMVLKGEEIRFSREFNVGGDTFTETLHTIVIPGQGTVELSREQAESLKRAHGIPYGDEEAGSAGSIPLSAVSVMLRPMLERLVRELWNSFDYCHEQFLGEAVSRVVLTGEGSKIRNLPEYLAGILKIAVERSDVSREYLGLADGGGASPGAGGSASDLGIGLALVRRGAINFLEPAGVGLPYRLAEAVPQRIAAGAAAMLLLSVAVPSEMSLLRERQRVDRLRAELKELEPRAGALHRFRAAREEETRLKDLLAHLSGGQVLWSYLLRDLSHRVGVDVRLTSLEVIESAAQTNVPETASAGRRVRITGLLRTSGRRPEDVLAELMESIARSPALDQIRLEGCQSVTAALSSFTVSARIAE